MISFMNFQCLLMSYSKRAEAFSVPSINLVPNPFPSKRPNKTSSPSTPVMMTVENLAILVRRMGMKWEFFQPETQILAASSPSQRLDSIPSPYSDTISLRYTSLTSQVTQSPTPSSLIIPTREASMLIFGILPPFPPLSIPSFRIGTIDDVYATMNILDPSCQASQTIKNVRGIEKTCTFGFSDLIPLACPMIRMRGSKLIRLPVPSEHCAGLTRHKESLVVFHQSLKRYIHDRNGGASERTVWVLAQYEALRQFAEWEEEIQPLTAINQGRLDFLEEAHTVWEQATAYFIALEQNPDARFRYHDLMAAHITHAVRYWNAAWKRVNARQRIPEPFEPGNFIAQGAHVYWDHLPKIADSLAAKSSGTGSEMRESVDEAWFVMMLRAFCWWRCHWVDQGWVGTADVRVGSRYWQDERKVLVV